MTNEQMNKWFNRVDLEVKFCLQLPYKFGFFFVPEQRIDQSKESYYEDLQELVLDFLCNAQKVNKEEIDNLIKQFDQKVLDNA